MTRKEFIEILDEKGYSYEIVGDKIVVTHRGNVFLNSLKTLPSDVVFRNEGYVELKSVTSIPPGVEFKNGGGVISKIITGGFLLLKWDGDIDGIDFKRLLNLMIKQGVFI